MNQEQYIQLQNLLKEIEEDNKTAKVILFFEDGQIRKVELDIKVDMLLTIRPIA